MTQRRIPAVYMRGGTSKGVFFRKEDLPEDPLARDRILLRVIGSPDVYGRHIDGMGGATSSTSKVAIVSRSARDDSDVDFLFGAVAIGEPVIDWSGNCGNLTSAVGPFAIAQGWVAPIEGMTCVRIWQANIAKRILAHVPVRNGEVAEEGAFELDGVAFPGAQIRIEFLDPAGSAGMALLPTGRAVDRLHVPGVGSLDATLINAGNPTIIAAAAALGLRGTEMQADIDVDAPLLERLEQVRACGAVAMGLAGDAKEATRLRPATPKIAFVAPAAGYRAASGRAIRPEDIDVVTRIMSMGRLHHALTGTGAIAFAVAAVVPGTVLHDITGTRRAGEDLRLGHPSGVLRVGAQVDERDGRWEVSKAIVSRSARRLMAGEVFVPEA